MTQALIQVSAVPPVSVFDAGRVAQPGPRTQVENDRIDGRGPVCVGDDDNWACDSLSVMLEAHGFTVRAYSSGAELLADDGRAAAKCLVIDQQMPGLDGLSVIAELRRQRIVLPTILITGRLDANIEQRAGALGILAILEKPFSAPRLVELIHRACGPRQ
jgi:two-component system, LuxR family, response regulator FixJ